MTSISVIGVGSMGRPMAERLIAAGHEVTVCDIRDEALQPFRDRGVRTVTRAADCAAAAVVIVMVGHDGDVADVTTGPGGLAEAIGASHVAIMSSVLPQTVKTAAAALAPRGAVVVDAPVSGGPVRAAQGTISIMAAGDDDAFAVLQPVYDILGRPVFRCGPVGAAAGVKIVNNMLGVTNMLLMGEAVHLATRLGIDLDFLVGVMEVSSGRNSATEDADATRALYRANSAEPDVTRRLLAILRKDLGLAATLAGAEGIDAPVLRAVAEATRGIEAGDLFERWRETLDAAGCATS
jgi:3-hydroxyisobutyrate dehydrogenase